MATKVFSSRVSFGKQALRIDTIEEVDKQKKYVKWGRKNDFPDVAIELFNSSPLHQGIINAKLSYIVGDGWEFDGDTEVLFENGLSDLNLDDVADEICLDLEIFGGFVLKCVRNREGGLAYVEPLAFENCRVNADLSVLYYSLDFSDIKKEVKTYQAYNNTDNQSVFFLLFKEPTKRGKKEIGIYPKPSYFAGLKDIESDKEIINFRLNEINNFFSSGTIINVPSGVPITEDEIQDSRKLVNSLTGSDNAGSVVVNFSDGKENELSVLHLSGNDLHNRYERTETSVQNNILVAHSVPSPMLVGIKTKGQLGGSNEILTSFEIWKKTYIKKKQRIINNAFQFIATEIAGLSGSLRLVEPTLPIERTSVNMPARPQTETEEFSKIDDIISRFAKVGVPISELKFYNSREIPNGSDSDMVGQFEADYLDEFFSDLGTLTASSKTLSVLDLMRKGEGLTSIAEILELPLKDVTKIVNNLTDSGMVEGLEVTNKGRQLVEAANVPTDEFEVRYTYAKREGVEGLEVIPTTRDFCRAIIELGRAFTREEINQISAVEGYDVFKFKGGFYHNPKTDITTPYCRHTWKFNLIRKS
jgi:hypothetical protein